MRTRFATAGIVSLLVLITALVTCFNTPQVPREITSPLTPVMQPGEGFFQTAIPLPDFPDGPDWINTKTKLELSDLKGKLVLLDFWTYCCINCMHVLPTLDAIEKKYEKQLVVVGVHTAKFETEKNTENIRSAIVRYEIRHPILNDAQHILWNSLQINSWPTLVLVDPEGRAIWAHAGEIAFDDLDRIVQRAANYYQRRGELDTRSVRFDLALDAAEDTPLRFPGKLAVDSAQERLFISDSNHNRIVVSSLDGKLLDIIGSGEIGLEDGDFAKAQFKRPQGIALAGDTLFIADTENHLIRAANLKSRQVTRVAGTGKQTQSAWFGANPNIAFTRRPTRKPLTADIASPWELLVYDDSLFIAMAGTHQIWTMDLEGKAIGPWAGNGSEDIVDGPLLPKTAYGVGSSFAQPSGLSRDDQHLYVADSEGSSIRVVPLSGVGEVTTLVGTSKLERGRLFTFGNQNGDTSAALFQHPLGVVHHAGRVYVADTYNSTIREIDLIAKQVRTVVQPNNPEGKPQLYEPCGIAVFDDKLFIADTNNHQIKVFNLVDKSLTDFVIDGLKPLKVRQAKPKSLKLPSSAVEHQLGNISIAPSATELKVPIEFELPTGWKLNPEAPLGYIALWKSGDEVLKESTSGTLETAEPIVLTLKLPTNSEELKLQLAFSYYFCRTDGKGLCLAEQEIHTANIGRDSTNLELPIHIKIPSR